MNRRDFMKASAVKAAIVAIPTITYATGGLVKETPLVEVGIKPSIRRKMDQREEWLQHRWGAAQRAVNPGLDMNCSVEKCGDLMHVVSCSFKQSSVGFYFGSIEGVKGMLKGKIRKDGERCGSIWIGRQDVQRLITYLQKCLEYEKASDEFFAYKESHNQCR